MRDLKKVTERQVSAQWDMLNHIEWYGVVAGPCE
jgi:hypothetical protein